MDRNIIKIPLENRRFKRNGRFLIMRNKNGSLYFEVCDDKGKLFGRAWILHEEEVRSMRRWLGRAIRKQESEL